MAHDGSYAAYGNPSHFSAGGLTNPASAQPAIMRTIPGTRKSRPLKPPRP